MPRSRKPFGRSRPLLAIAVAALTFAVLAAVPAVTGTTWGAVLHLLAGVPAGWIGWLTAVWVAGLLAAAPLQTATLPGLTVRQAIGLSLAGSALGNVLPLGGTASMGVQAAMARSWGFAAAPFGASLAVTTLWTGLSRIVLGVLAVAAWQLARPTTGDPGRVMVVLVPALVVLVVTGGLVGSGRACGTAARLVGRLVDLVPVPGQRPARAARDLPRAVDRVRRLAFEVSRRSWRRIVVSLLVYNALLVLLLDGSLRAVGGATPIIVVCAAVGLERLLTAVPVTPGGAGAAELGLVAVLTASGTPAAAAAAGALLYRLFTFGLEVPTGAPVLAAWLLNRGRRDRTRITTSSRAAGVAA